MRKIITYGTFDLLHIGHISILERAKKLGDYLVVGISSDEFNQEKGKSSIYTFNERVKIVSAIRYVNEVIQESNWSQKITDIQQHQIDVFVIGDDWAGKFDYLSKYCEVVYLPRTRGISTTETKENIICG